MKCPKLFKPFLYFILFSFSGPSVWGQIYVRADAPGGNGTSWEEAYNNLQDALQQALPGDSIWMAQGTYLPDTGSMDPATTFLLENDLRIYGGFAGSGDDPDQRDPAVFQTVISGDLLGDDVAGRLDTNRTDNSARIFTITDSITDQTVIDGLIIRGGSATKGSTRFGGAMYITGVPIIRNCIFDDNLATVDGGAVYLTGVSNAEKATLFENCMFRNNGARQNGGGLYSLRKVTLNQCDFLDNLASGNGGGFQLSGLNAGNALIEDCTMDGNEAGDQGGGFTLSGLRGNGAVIRRCSIIQNEGGWAGGLYVLNSAVEINHSQFLKNFTTRQGGGVRVFQTSGNGRLPVSVDSCAFEENTASFGGGFYYLTGAQGSRISISNTTFTANKVDSLRENWGQGGAGLCVTTIDAADEAEMLIENNAFSGNTASFGAAGIGFFTYTSQLKIGIRKTQFIENKTTSRGGGVELFAIGENGENDFLIDSCFFEKNEASFGGGLYYISASPNNRFSLHNSTFEQNRVAPLIPDWDQGGGGLCMFLDSLATNNEVFIEKSAFNQNNSTFWGGGAGGSFLGQKQHLYLKESSFSENSAAEGGGGLDLYGASLGVSFKVERSSFNSNAANLVGGGVRVWYEQEFESLFDSLTTEITHCTFEGNRSRQGAGLQIVGGRIDGTELPEYLSVKVSNTLFTDHSGDFGVLNNIMPVADLALFNTTVAQNMINGLEVSDGAQLTLQNNIIYNPGFAEFNTFSDTASVVSRGGNLIGDNSLSSFMGEMDLQEMNPMFVVDGYQLETGSPAIDAGVLPDSLSEFDLAGHPRLVGEGIDIGAYEKQLATSNSTDQRAEYALKLAPNPVSEWLEVVLDNQWRGPVDLMVYNGLGQLVQYQKFDKTIEPLKVNLTVHSLPSGSYHLVASHNRGKVHKVFIVK